MDSKSSHIDFALIAHQDSWKNIAGCMDIFTSGERQLSEAQLAEVYSFIPPGPLFHIEARSITGQTIQGAYIETFIPPDELNQPFWKKNLVKVKEAASCARKLQAPVAALGGFTSIVLEGRDDTLNETPGTRFTTGNTLTAAFIARNIEAACLRFGKTLKEQQLLVIGATGDIGSACIRYFAGKVKKLLLCARQQGPLNTLAGALLHQGISLETSADIKRFLPQADIVIAITNSLLESFDPALCKKDIIICDAGYPKNLVFELKGHLSKRLFCGGMGQIQGGYSFHPEIHNRFYQYPAANIGHGCMLEAIVLAFEKKHEPFSAGKGNITPEKMEHIYTLATKHGIVESPLFNPLGLWDQVPT